MPANTPSKVSERHASWALFLAGMTLVALRYPELVREPRLFGEEGVLFLSNAYAKPWYETLFAPAVGYYCLFLAGPTTFVAHLVPVEYVAHFTTGFALIIQAIPVALVTWGRAALWRGLPERALGLCIVVFNPLGEEIWLTTTCLQFHFVLVAFLVFLELPASETLRERRLHRALLIAAGLAGPPPCTLSPLFVLNALWTREREAFVRAGILSLVTLVQLGMVLAAATLNPGVGSAQRFANLDVATIASAALGKAVIVPFLGLAYGESFAAVFDWLRKQGPDFVLLGGLGCLLALGGVGFLIGRRAAAAERVIYLGTSAFLVVSSMFLGLGDTKGWVHPAWAGRYFYVPGVLLLLLLLSQLDLRRWRAWTGYQWGAACALALGLLVQVADFDERFFPWAQQPSWSEEVARWRKDPRHRLAISPAGWSFTIPAPHDEGL